MNLFCKIKFSLSVSSSCHSDSFKSFAVNIRWWIATHVVTTWLTCDSTWPTMWPLQLGTRSITCQARAVVWNVSTIWLIANWVLISKTVFHTVALLALPRAIQSVAPRQNNAKHIRPWINILTWFVSVFVSILHMETSRVKEYECFKLQRSAREFDSIACSRWDWETNVFVYYVTVDLSVWYRFPFVKHSVSLFTSEIRF